MVECRGPGSTHGRVRENVDWPVPGRPGARRDPRTARTVKVRGGKVLRTDGPFAETKEQLGGFILIDARDMDQAVEIAAGIPMARLWSIEVRPILELTRG